MMYKLKTRHKFNAKKVNDNGQTFASKLEYQYYLFLLQEIQRGVVVFFLRQTPFHLPGGVKYIADYLVFYADGTCRVVDVKGVETDTFKMKKKLVESLYPIEIDIIKRGEF